MTTTVIIIAAGRGTRLAPYTNNKPKCLVSIGEFTILDWQLRTFAAHDIKNFVIICGYQQQAIKEHCKSYTQNIIFINNDDYANNNILTSLLYAIDHIKDDILITYSDLFITTDVLSSLLNSPADIALSVDKNFIKIYEGRTDHPLSEAEVCAVTDTLKIQTIGKRSLPPEQAWGEFIGLLHLTSNGSAIVQRTCKDIQKNTAPNAPFIRAKTFNQAYLTDMFQHMINQGIDIYAAPLLGYWREIDTVQDKQRTEQLLIKEKMS